MNPVDPNRYVPPYDFGDDSSEIQEESASYPSPAPVKKSSDERRELRAKIQAHKDYVGLEYVQDQRLWLQEIIDVASGKRVEGIHRPSLSSVSDVSSQDRNREEQNLASDLTNAELKTFGRNISNWAIFGLIHHFSILGGSPNRSFDFGEVSGIIGRTRASENPEKEALDLYIAHCAQKLGWGDFQAAVQSIWIRTSYWILSGVFPETIEKTLSNVLDKIRLKGREGGNFEFVSWKLVEHLEGFLKRYGEASADGPSVNLEELKALCDELAPFFIHEFLPQLTLCEDRLNQIPFLSFFSFLCRPIDLLLNAFIHYAASRSFPGLLKRGLGSLEKIIGGKTDQINYRMANPVLAFINGKLEYFIQLIKNPSPEPGSPLPSDVQKKLKPLADELMRTSKVPCMEIEIKEYLASILESSPMGPIREHIQRVLEGDYQGVELRKQVQSLASNIAAEWDKDVGDRLSNLSNVPPIKEKIREEIRSGVIKGVYSLMQYLQKEQVQEVILQKTLNLSINSLFSENQTPPLPEEEIYGKYESLLRDQEVLFQTISESLVDSVVDVKAAKWIYGNPDKQVNHHWSTHHSKIKGYLDAGISDKIISITNALEVVQEETRDLESSQFLAVLTKHLVFWEGFCAILQDATYEAPPKSKDKIKKEFNWLYEEAHAQIDRIADLKKEWDSCLVRRDLKVLYNKMHDGLQRKMLDYKTAKERSAAKGLALITLQMNELMSHVPTSEGDRCDIASMADEISVLIQKEIELKEAPEMILGELEKSELERQKELLNTCRSIVVQSKNMTYTAKSVNKAFNDLKRKVIAESNEYEAREKESRQSLISKISELHAGHEERLKTIRKIQCDKIPASIRERWGVGGWVASAISWTDPVSWVDSDSVNAIGPSKQALKGDISSMVNTLMPLAIASPSEPLRGEVQAGVVSIETPLPRKNFYTWIERLILSSLRSYYQAH